MYHFKSFCLKGSHTAMFAYQKVSIFDIERTLRGLVYQHNFIRGGSNLTSFAYTIQKAPSPENSSEGVYNSLDSILVLFLKRLYRCYHSSISLCSKRVGLYMTGNITDYITTTYKYNKPRFFNFEIEHFPSTDGCPAFTIHNQASFRHHTFG